MLRSNGKIKDGRKGFYPLELPSGGGSCPLIPAWPEFLSRGSLDVHIEPDGFPSRLVDELDDTQIR